MTGRPASRSAFAVPPVLNSSTLRAASARAKSTRPVLSETDRRARRIVTSMESLFYWPEESRPEILARKTELAKFLAQSAPVDAEDGRGAALVARGIVQDGAEQRLFDFAKHEVVEVCRLMTVQVGEIIGKRTFGVVTQGHFERAIATGVFSSPRSFRRHSRPINVSEPEHFLP